MFQYLVMTSPDLINSASLILRVFIGICFIVHGLGKGGFVGTGNMAGFVGWLKSLNVPFPEVQARAAMVAEILGGALLLVGLFHRAGCVLVFIIMVVAALIGHKNSGYLITNNPPGNEYTVNLAAITVVMFLIGPGSYSLDYYFLTI